MNRRERRELIRNNKQIVSKCPNCGKQSMFCTDKDLNVRCVLCGHIIPLSKKPKEQSFINFNISDNEVCKVNLKGE